MLFSLPNILTLFRLLVAPLYLLIYSTYATPLSSFILLLLLLLAESSDLMDGFLARRWGQVTNLGKILDPFADSLYRVTVLMTLTLPPVSLPLYLILIFLYRDASISTLRTFVALKGVALQARWSGKVKAVLQGGTIIFITLLLCLFSFKIIENESLTTISTLLATGVAIYTLFSGVEYLLAVKKANI